MYMYMCTSSLNLLLLALLLGDGLGIGLTICNASGPKTQNKYTIHVTLKYVRRKQKTHQSVYYYKVNVHCNYINNTKQKVMCTDTIHSKYTLLRSHHKYCWVCSPSVAYIPHTLLLVLY